MKKTNKAFDPQIVKIIIDKYNCGMTAKSIGIEFGMHERSIRRYLNVNNVPTHRKTKQDLSQNLSGMKFGRIAVIDFSHKVERKNKNRSSDYYWN